MNASAHTRAMEIAGILAGLGTISVSRFFGGAALRAEGVQFAFVMKGSLYLRANEESRPLFEAKGALPFVYAGRAGRVTVTSYYETPDDVIDDSEVLCRWARHALQAALGGAARKSRRRRSV